MQKKNQVIFICLGLCLATLTFARGAWMTGPLLAPSGRTIQPGHFNFEPYVFYTRIADDTQQIEPIPVLVIGVTDFLDIQSSLPYDFNSHKTQHASHIGDGTLGVGLQLVRQTETSWYPDLRLTVQEIFPTGTFEDLNPQKLGTDQSGRGVYQTTLGLNFQYVKTFKTDHYLRSRFSVLGRKSSGVSVHGASAFGGNPLTHGRVHPGDSFSADLAFEYTLTQNIVPVFEMLYSQSKSTGFIGDAGFTPDGTTDTVGAHGGHLMSLAPAIEYNFNPHLGIIGGVWFSVTGPSANSFTTTAIAINYYY